MDFSRSQVREEEKEDNLESISGKRIKLELDDGKCDHSEEENGEEDLGDLEQGSQINLKSIANKRNKLEVEDDKGDQSEEDGEEPGDFEQGSQIERNLSPEIAIKKERQRDEDEDCQSLETSQSEPKERERKRKKGKRDEFNPKMQQCEICSVNYPLQYMPKHMPKHVGEYAFQCPNPECSFTFLSKWSKSVRQHIVKRKSKCWNDLGKPKQLQDVIPFKCDTCERVFDGLSSLYYHLRQEHEAEEGKVFKCPLTPCKVSYVNKQTIEIHLTRHDFCPNAPKFLKKRKQYPNLKLCKLCPPFPFKKAFLVHPQEDSKMINHLKEKHDLQDWDIVRCPIECDAVFPFGEGFAEHVLDFHPRKDGAPLFCLICDIGHWTRKEDIKFKNPREVKQHYYSEHGIGRLLECDREDCGFSTFYMKEMTWHKKKHPYWDRQASSSQTTDSDLGGADADEMGMAGNNSASNQDPGMDDEGEGDAEGEAENGDEEMEGNDN